MAEVTTSVVESFNLSLNRKEAIFLINLLGTAVLGGGEARAISSSIYDLLVGATHYKINSPWDNWDSYSPGYINVTNMPLI